MKLKQISFNRKYTGIVIALVTFAVLVMVFGATLTPIVHAQATATPSNTPTTAPTATLTPTPLATSVANPQGAGFVQYLRCGNYSFGQITPGACLQIYNGSDIDMYSAAGRRTVNIDGETGVITTYGGIGQGSGEAGAGSSVKCVFGSQSVTGLATVIAATPAAAGISTPQFVLQSLGTTSTGDIHHLSSTNSAGVVTLQVWNSALTPAAASGAATVNYEICGQ